MVVEGECYIARGGGQEIGHHRAPIMVVIQVVICIQLGGSPTDLHALDTLFYSESAHKNQAIDLPKTQSFMKLINDLEWMSRFLECNTRICKELSLL